MHDAIEASGQDSHGSLAEADLYQRLKSWFIEDRRANAEWYKEAETDYAFHSGHGQWEDIDRLRLKGQNRPCITFNRIAPAIAAVVGMEVVNRQEVRYIPRTTSSAMMHGPVNPATGRPEMVPVPGADDAGPAELYTSAAHYMRDQCNAEDEESDAFQDVAICGMGWIETRVDYDTDPSGKIVIDRVDPLEMAWDGKSSKRNLIDARRIHRAREIDIDVARAMFPGFEDDELDAGWAQSALLEASPHDREAARNYESGAVTEVRDRKTVTIVETEWWEQETSWRAADPETNEVIEVDDLEALRSLKERANNLGRVLAVATQHRRIYKRAFLGATLLESGKAQSQAGFKFKAITGHRDRNKRQWLGLVRAMRDPQRWANALFSSVLHAIQTSGKGIMAERGTFDNDGQAETDWANTARIVWLKAGAISGVSPKIMPKPQASLPAGVDAMMQFALQSMRDVSGINVEVLGLADRQQAASLEYQRRQAATSMLAPFFDGLRRYRKDQGRLLLHLIRDYLSDGRLIRIAGPELEKYAPLVRDESVREFDIIVDEAPASPNQKEATWGILQQMMPLLMRQNLPLEGWGKLLKASPLPNSLVAEFIAILQKANEPQQPAGSSPAELQMQAEMERFQSETALQQQELELKRFEAETKAEIALRQLADKEAQRQHEMALRVVGKPCPAAIGAGSPCQQSA